MANPEFALVEQAIKIASENWEAITASLFVLGMAFTVKQRMAIRTRDNEECQAGDIIPHKHRGRIEVHHITPQAYMYANESDPDYAENALSVCQEAHQRVHPDLADALDDYRKGDKNSFKKMALQQQLDASRDKTYWDTRWDAKMNARARRNTEKAKSKGWIFPSKNGDKEDGGESGEQ